MLLATVPGPRLDALVRAGSVPEGCLEATGRALAVLHLAAPPPGLGPVRPEAPPWEPVTPITWLGLSSVQRQLVGVFHTDVELRERGRWTRDAARVGDVWCHGDARTNNVCVTPAGRPQLIDWEASGRGRPEADLGGCCASLIADSLLGATGPPGAEARVAIASAMGRATGHIRTLLAGYRACEPRAADTVLLGAVVGAALLTRTFMRTSVTRRDRVAAGMYEIGRALLLDPTRWRAIDGAR